MILPTDILHHKLVSFLDDASCFNIARLNKEYRNSFLHYPFALQQRVCIFTPPYSHRYQILAMRPYQDFHPVDVYRITNIDLRILPTEHVTSNSIIQHAKCLELCCVWTENMVFPQRLVKLDCRRLKNDIPFKFPETLTCLRMPITYNKPLPILPISLQTLDLGYEFNQPLDNLPLSITSLHIGTDFNHPLHLRYTNIQNLYLFFDQPVLEIELPNSLLHIEFPYHFNGPVTFPPNVHTIKFGNRFNQTNVRFPPSVKRLTFGEQFNQPVILPPFLETLQFSRIFNQPLLLPETLRVLDFSFIGNFNQQLQLPSSLETVRFGEYYNQPTIFPTSIQEISFPFQSQFNHPLDLSACSLLKKVTMGPCFTSTLRVPEGLPSLILTTEMTEENLNNIVGKVKSIIYAHPQNLSRRLNYKIKS